MCCHYRRLGEQIQKIDVKTKPKFLDMGTLSYNPDVILMADYDGNKTYIDLDMLDLIFLPLMYHTIPRKELAAKKIDNRDSSDL